MSTRNLNKEAHEVLSKAQHILHRANVPVDVDAIHSVSRILRRFDDLVEAVASKDVLVLQVLPEEDPGFGADEYYEYAPEALA